MFAVFALAKLMNVKEDQGQLSTIARYSIYLVGSFYMIINVSDDFCNESQDC